MWPTLRSIVSNLSISSIKIHKFTVIEKNEKQSKKFCDIANVHQKELPLPVVGRVNEKFYLLNRFDVFDGVKKSHVDNIECTVTDFDNEAEFLIEHVRSNNIMPAFNQLKLFPLIEYLKTKSINSEQILGLLQIHKTVDEDILNLVLSPEAITELSNIFIYLSQHITKPTMPFFAIKLVANCDFNKQKDAAILLRKIINTKRINDSKFNWPSYKEIKLRLDDPDFYQKRHESIISIPDGEKPSKSNLKDANDLKSMVNDSIIIVKTDSNPRMTVNKKTGEVKIASKKGENTQLEMIDSHQSIVLSGKEVGDLNFKKISDVKSSFFESNEKAHQILDSHLNIKGIITYVKT